MTIPVQEMRAVSFAYPSRPTVLEAVDFAVREGDLVVVSGPSGGGKSTFLRLLCLLETPTRGEIRFRGAPLSDLPAPEARRKLAYLQQVPVVLPLSIEENLCFPFTRRSNRLRRPSRADLERMLAKVGLPVRGLKRTKIGRLDLRGLGVGSSRPLTTTEVAYLKGIAGRPERQS